MSAAGRAEWLGGTVSSAKGRPSLEHKAAVGLAIKEGYAKIEKQRDDVGKEINGWRVGSAFGDRPF